MLDPDEAEHQVALGLLLISAQVETGAEIAAGTLQHHQSLRPKQDVAAAKAFLRKAPNTQAMAPTSITLDSYTASHRAVRELAAENPMLDKTKLRPSKYLNNMIEQDHRNVKLRVATMLGFKRVKCAAVTIAGIELLRRNRKGQFSLRCLRLQGQAASGVWNAVLAA